MGPTDVLRQDIDSFVDALLANRVPHVPTAPKVIHDPIWGTHRFWPHEIAIIDSPVLQRLRRIYQTGYSYLTFPSTTQTRFEHSLGAAVVGTQMLEAIARRHPKQVDLCPLRGDLAQIRVAALLHDCGHGFASHASERLYKWYQPFQVLAQSDQRFQNAKASEILSWYIITSPAFQGYLSEINQACGTSLDAFRIANLILGLPYDSKDFIAEILNGPFDVDRVDYTVRDADYAGMKAGIDLERFFHDIDISLLDDGRPHLVLHSTHAIEQLLWSKVHLFVRLYRHQKVLATDCLIQNIARITRERGTSFLEVDFSNVSDYLRITDIDILGSRMEGLEPSLATLVENLRLRRLPQRCVRITQNALKSGDKWNLAMNEIRRLNETSGGFHSLRNEIWEAIPEERRPQDPLSILIAIPPALALREASQVYILERGQSKATTLNSVFRIDEWLETYTESHWAGYIFTDDEHVDAVTEATLGVLEEHGVQLDPEISTSFRRSTAFSYVPTSSRPPPPSEQQFLDVTSQLPVLNGFTEKQTKLASPEPFESIHAVFIVHFLTDLPPFLSCFEKLGLDPKNSWLIRKPYSYPLAKELTEELRKRGYKIMECTAAEQPEEPTRRVLQELSEELGADDLFLIVEDGGYATPMLHLPEFADLRERCLGVVEQTTKGLRAIDKVSTQSGLKLPVIAVARSRLKLIIEAPEVGDSLAFALETYFRRFRGIPLRLRALIIGFGPVGQGLAIALQSHGSRVTVYDEKSYIREKAANVRPLGFDVCDNLESLDSFELIVGTTGVTSLGVDHFQQLQDGVILASGSSDRLEFDVPGLIQQVSEPLDDNIAVEGLLTRYTLKNGRKIGILCDGFPINFVLGDGIAKSTIDPILTELLAGAQLIALRQISDPRIHDIPSKLEDEILDAYRKQK